MIGLPLVELMAEAKALSERVIVHRLGAKTPGIKLRGCTPNKKESAVTGSNDDTSKAT
jgi:hypothetical protein